MSVLKLEHHSEASKKNTNYTRRSSESKREIGCIWLRSTWPGVSVSKWIDLTTTTAVVYSFHKTCFIIKTIRKLSKPSWTATKHSSDCLIATDIDWNVCQFQLTDNLLTNKYGTASNEYNQKRQVGLESCSNSTNHYWLSITKLSCFHALHSTQRRLPLSSSFSSFSRSSWTFLSPTFIIKALNVISMSRWQQTYPAGQCSETSSKSVPLIVACSCRIFSILFSVFVPFLDPVILDSTAKAVYMYM